MNSSLLPSVADRRDPLLPAKLAAHRGLRWLRWAWEARAYARRRPLSGAAWTELARHRSRVVRDPARAVLEMTAGKAANLRLGAAALDGVVIAPGETLSFWWTIGAPTEKRGFRRGMELRSGCIVPSVGGGICQLAGALVEVALAAGLTLVEHHPHSLEIAPERDRIRPFGAGAAVLYPHRDVRVRNDGARPVALRARCADGWLAVSVLGAARRCTDLALEERAYRVERAGGRTYRAGELWQVCRDRRSGELLWERCVLARRVEVLAEMPLHHCFTCDRACPNALPADAPERRVADAELGLARLSPAA